MMVQSFGPEMHIQQVGAQPAVTSIGPAGKTLYTFAPFDAGLLNVKDTRLLVRGNIAYSSSVSETPLISLSFDFDDGTDVLGIIFITSGAVSVSNNDSPIRFNFNIVTDTEGTSAAFIGTGDMFVTNLGTTLASNMLAEWLSADQLDATKPITARLKIAASTTLSSAHLVEAFLSIK